MRRLLIGMTVVALLWCGWWVLGAWAIERGVAQWRTNRIAEGWHTRRHCDLLAIWVAA